MVETTQIQFINASGGCSRDGTQTGPLVQRVQKTVEVPQIQFIDKLVDAPVNMQR